MKSRRPAALVWLGRAAVLIAVIAGMLAVLWGARLACEANPDCPWPVLWRSR
ncbi:hypothetical protein [Thalassobaculum sp.]|uniref:hypothetical protein n=1 Tax=Thalassobaculum sp. TaxID=2022740 RepID=UPI0032EFBB84